MLQKFKIFLLPSALFIVVFGFFLSCENPFSPNLGRKVDVVPPAVIVRSPVSGGFIRGVALFEGRATAYRSLKRVEYKIFANDATGQALVDWREVHYVNTNNSKEREWYLDLDTSRLNRGNDGSIKMQFRAIDDSQKGETVEFVYIVKNRPSIISITTPAEDLTNPNTTPKLVNGTDIRGNVTDRKGLKPGFPQIKIWPDDLGFEPDPNDNYSDTDNVDWGWASLFLPGVGNADVGLDDLEGIPPGGWLPQGSYADRTKMAPVRVAQFAFRLDKFTVAPDPSNPDIRRVVYETDGGGNRVHMEPGRLYYFRIRTSDTNTYDETEKEKFQLPIRYVTQKELDDINEELAKDPGNKDLIKQKARMLEDQQLFGDNLVGHFPPVNYGEANENYFRKRPEPIKLTLISDAVPPDIILDNADVSSNADWNKKPHKYIDEPTVKKIAAEDPLTPAGTLFRLRIKGVHPDGINMAILKYTHDATGREGYLKWDPNPGADNQGYISVENELEKAKQGHKGVYIDSNDRTIGTIFTFTADAENQRDIVTGLPIFTTSSGPYILEAVVSSITNSVNSAKYVVYMDGVGPDVSIQEIVGASSEVEPISDDDQKDLDVLAAAAGGVINGSHYTVNNNIQVVVNRFDDSGIMQNISPDSTNPNDPDPITPAPARPKADVLALPMAKWIVEEDTGANYFTRTDTVYQKLLAYRKNPTSANLKFFNDITDSTVNPAISGWVNLPKGSGKPADQKNNFKFNTRSFDGKTLWIYVISQDTVQNLGFVMQRIKVDQSSDTPKLKVDALTDENGAGTPINGTSYNTALNVIVDTDRKLSGNITQGSNFRNNVLERNQGIDLNFIDYDGINLGSGISISISDLNGQGPNGANLTETLTVAEIRSIFENKGGNKTNWDAVFSQQMMATVLYKSLPAAQRPNPMHLYDGIYRIEITYRDDLDEKVAITLADRPGMTALQNGDTPVSVPGNPSPKIYYFAVNAEDERPQIFVDSVAENQMQSDLPVTVSGRVRSRLKVQRLWISFTPNIFDTNLGYNSTFTEEITTLYTSDTYATAIPQANFLAHEGKDADGYYIYYWKRENVVFQPDGHKYGVDEDNRRVSLEAYDRLGNRNSYTRTVLVDATPPSVSIDFNYGRSPDEMGMRIVNGKVPFTVMANDNNKLAEFDRPGYPNDPYSGVKWWVLPAASPAPDWDTAVPTGTAGTGGWFYRSQEANGGRFTAVINTTLLTDLANYKLHLIVQDTAGNRARTGIPPAPGIIEFHIDQSTDLPLFNIDNLKPALGSIMGNTNISVSGGLASDDDGFDRDNKTNQAKLPPISVIGENGYVQIRFPVSPWNSDGTAGTGGWGPWISVYGTFNPEGAIRFDFKVDDIPNGIANPAFTGYFNSDGAKHYQIKVTDEAVAGPNDRPPGKNPDGEQPGGPTYLPAVSRIFPLKVLATDPDTYNFVLDNKPPEIFFDKYDPSSGPSVHLNYNSIRPAYSSFALLAADLKGSVQENNFETLTIIWDADRQQIKDKNSPSTLNNGVREYRWDINDQDSVAIKAKFEERFKSVGEGLHSIILEATDTANNKTRIEWMFYKDTQGPNIIVTSIRRVISHSPVPAASVFPDNWPLDWPYGPNWKTDTRWDLLRAANYGLANWSSEYAYLTGVDTAAKIDKVIAALNAENGRDIALGGKDVSVISGEMGKVYIRGTFSDDLTDIWDDPNVPQPFFFRFNKGTRPADISLPADWERKVFESYSGNSKSADWEIPIPDTINDGEHTLDIKVADKAGNWADIYSLRFIVDRNNPKLLGYNTAGTGVDINAAVPQSFRVDGGGAENKPLPEETERVFSAAGSSIAPNATNTVFSLKGFVRDNNLGELIVVITSEGTNPYTVTANINVGAWVSGGPEVSSTNDSDGRLKIQPTTVSNENEWMWTLDVLEKDVAGLRSQAFSTDATRRYITVTAIDKAKRRDGPQRWNFYLDTKKPVIEYTNNLEKGPNFTLNSGEYNSIILQGIASDDTKIRDVQYSLAKWDYAANSGAGAWRWYNTTAPVGWTLTAQPAPANWPSMLNSGYNASNATSTVSWTLNNAKLNEWAPGSNLFQTEGKYKLDLYVTDWSLSSDAGLRGNPHNTALVNDPLYQDKGNLISGGAANSYNPATGDGNASARQFYIDRTDPIIVDKDDKKTYYRTNNSEFEFTASDGNTITEISARIKTTDGKSYEVAAGLITLTHIPGTEWNYDVTIKPEMKDNLNAQLPFGNYSLEITAKDGAGRETTVTKQFTLDDEAPTLTVVSPPPSSPPSNSTEAVTGRVVIRGNTTENSNLIKKVAFYVANSGNSFAAPTGNLAYTPGIDADTAFARGWHFYQDPTNRHQINYTNPAPATGGGVLIFIEQGSFTWNIRIPNARNFNVSAERNTYVQWMTKAAAGETANLTYNGKTIPLDEDVGKLTLYIVAEDEAGNVKQETVTYWLYPEGDRPTVSFSNPDDKKIEAERLMNGRIRVAGMARDNERVKYVWFRVLDSNGNAYTNFKTTSILSWNTETWEVATAQELAAGGDRVIDNRNPTVLFDEAGNNLGGGWYRANGGGSPNVSWWTYINMEGELEPQGGTGANRITIQARAEDTTRRDDNDEWVAMSVKGMVSRDKGDLDAVPPRLPPATNVGHSVTALVVQGAPIFDNEEVRTGSSALANTTPWGSIASSSLSKRASYRIVVKDDSGVGAIRWTRTRWNSAENRFDPIGTVNLLDPDQPYNTRTGTGAETYAGHLARMDTSPYDATTNPGIAVKAEPNPAGLKTSGSGPLPAGTYLIWEPGTIPAPGYQNFLTEGISSNVRYTTFTATAGFSITGAAQVIQRGTQVKQGDGSLQWVDDGNYEWLVTVDVNTEVLDNKKYAADRYTDMENPDASFRYPLSLSATDISKATPLTTSNTSYLPIDNKPPKGSYTINTRPAGQAATVGGEAGDNDNSAPVGGIAKVVIWFSRDKDKSGTQTNVSWHENGVKTVHGDNSSAWKLNPVSDFQYDPVPITVTRIDTNRSSPTFGKLYQDTAFQMPKIPQPNSEGVHATTGGDYAIVIDRHDPSGVQTKWGQTLKMGFSSGGMGKIWYVELNSFGLVSGPVYIHYVVYDTANNASYFKERLVVMNNAPKIDRIKLGTDIRDISSLRAGSNASEKSGNPETTPVSSPLLDNIRNAVPAPAGTTTTDVQKGITDFISTIRTSETGAIRHIDFNARNKLLALRVETTQEPGDQKDRHFRFEYVSGARKLARLTDIKAGRMYVIDDPGNARWGAVGAPEVSQFTRGLAFMASLDGIDEETDIPRGELDAATGSVWELNSAYAGGRPTGNLALADVEYGVSPAEIDAARSAEFVYRGGAFGTTRGSSIVDYNPAVELARLDPNIDPSTANTLFILKIFDGQERDQFADFALLSFRVNDNDKTNPASQLYDLNPMTEGQERAQSVQRSLAPMGIGLNRTRGGLWNTDTTQRTVAKPGHIEPRRTTSLTSTQMGGAGTLAQNTVAQPFANTLAFYSTDTVSGRVVLRGYAEDDQRVNRIDLIFTDTSGGVANQTVTILDRSVAAGTNAPAASGGTPASYIPPTTGLLKVAANSATNPTTDRVYYTDDIDLYRHRVEWAYIWDTETIPAGLVVGNATVRAVVYNENSAGYDPVSAVKASANTLAPTTGQAGTLNNYNRINVNVRPYITGFVRNQSQFFHNTRSRQGWYPFSREEVAVVKGYNIGRANLTTNITLQGAANQTAAAVTAAQQTSHGLDSTNVSRYRAFTVSNNAIPGQVTMMVGTYQAVNNYTNGTTERPRLNAAGTAADTGGRFWVQPWNTEYSPGTAGSELWDDFTNVHIWQSTNVNENTGAGQDQGGFPNKRTGWDGAYLNPAMTMDPSNGGLYASQGEGGAGGGYNTGNTMVSNNFSSWAGSPKNAVTTYTSFIDPIIYSDIYMLPSGNATPQANTNAWVSQSLIGRSGTSTYWYDLGGVWITGPGGTNGGLNSGVGGTNPQYNAESTWYNAGNSGNATDPPSTDQFSHTHIIARVDGGNTHIHTSYYDTKDGSLKYRYNLRGAPGTINVNNSGTASVANAIPRQWTNLDGGFDSDDTVATIFINNNISNLAGAGTNTNIAANARVVNYNTRNGIAIANRIDAGEYNAIAVTSQGYPVVAYFDTTNQRLKLAVSRRVAPVLGADWTIRDNVIPNDNLSRNAGEFVSIAIDTQAGTNQNRIHMAALDSVRKNLVYITGIVNPTATGDGVLTNVDVRVVDHIGSVGRWCDISLDVDGNPWIAYQDESYRDSMDGVRMAFRNTATFPKAMGDAYGDSILGWETMNVPARFRVADKRISIENFPARNYAPTGNASRFWRAAVAFPSLDFFRLVYYVR